MERTISWASQGKEILGIEECHHPEDKPIEPTGLRIYDDGVW